LGQIAYPLVIRADISSYNKISSYIINSGNQFTKCAFAIAFLANDGKSVILI
jgi:hypothetical protein